MAEQTKTIQIIRQMIPEIDVDSDLLPSAFIDKYWTMYLNSQEQNNSLNGNIFEELIALTLVREGILPFYMQAQVAFIPNVNYDFVIYSEAIGPIVLSAKTSIRERYKQADLEAFVLKNVHRKSQSYLISMDEAETRTRRNKIEDVMAIDDFILATTPEYDALLASIKARNIIASPTIQIIESNVFVDQANMTERWGFA